MVSSPKRTASSQSDLIDLNPESSEPTPKISKTTFEFESFNDDILSLDYNSNIAKSTASAEPADDPLPESTIDEKSKSPEAPKNKKKTTVWRSGKAV